MQVHTTEQLVEGRRASSTELLLGAGLPASIMATPLVRSMFEAAFEVSMPHFTHVYEYVPKVLEKEKKALRKELSSGPVALIHDGATVLKKPSFVIVAVFVDENEWRICNRAIRLHVEDPSAGRAPNAMSSEYLYHLVQDTVKSFGLEDRVSLVQRDGCSVNGRLFQYLSLHHEH